MAHIEGTSSFDNLVGTFDDDSMYGFDAGDFLDGSRGDDYLYGGDGSDTLDGGDGNDSLYGSDNLFDSHGHDRLYGSEYFDFLDGEAGIDTASYNFRATAGVTVNLGLVGAQNTGGGGTDTLVNIENLDGSNDNDTLTGDNAKNVLSGLDGNDMLNGLGGSDTLRGADGDDQLYGGTGKDIFDYNSVSDSPSGTGKNGFTIGDVIHDFSGIQLIIFGVWGEEPIFTGERDQIDLTDIDANGDPSDGNQAFSYIGCNPFTAAGQLRYDGGILSSNTDADVATVELEIVLVGAPWLWVSSDVTESDILL